MGFPFKTPNIRKALPKVPKLRIGAPKVKAPKAP